MKSRVIALLFMGSLMGCGGTSNVFKNLEKKPSTAKEVARLLEEGNTDKAKNILLSQMPAAAQQLLINTDPGLDADYSFSKNLAASMTGVKDAEKNLGLYATAEAQSQGVGALNIMVEIVKIDDDLKKSSTALWLDKAADDEAISTFYPAMPAKCKSAAYQDVNRGLDKAIAIAYATLILAGLDPAEMSTLERHELGARLSKANRFNVAIFSQVNFICQIMHLDSDSDTMFSPDEVLAVDDDMAAEIEKRVIAAIDSIQAMVNANPKDKNLTKAVNRMKEYKSKLDEDAANLPLRLRVQAFLISQSRKL
jgi:hypothetical protein